MIVIGPIHCDTFWQLLSAFRWLEGKAREEGEAAFNSHIDDCPFCQGWISEIPEAYHANQL